MGVAHTYRKGLRFCMAGLLSVAVIVNAIAAVPVTQNTTLSPPTEYASSSDEIVDVFNNDQAVFRSSYPPMPDTNYTVFADGGLLNIDSSGFSSAFLDQISSSSTNSNHTCKITIVEEPETRYRMLFNSDNNLLTVMPPPADYNPLWFAWEQCPDLYNGQRTLEEILFIEGIYDTARIAVRYTVNSAPAPLNALRTTSAFVPPFPEPVPGNTNYMTFSRGVVAGGFEHSIYAREDGSVWAWGSNKYGQLGLGTAGSPELISVQMHNTNDVGFLQGP